jgi:virulence factor Mce-like protein
MSRIGRGLKVLIVLVVAAAAGWGGVDTLRTPTVTYTADFDNVDGLYAGNAVSVLGMRVGKVTGIANHGSYVAVTLAVDASIKIPADAQAVVVSDSVLTDRHVELTPVYRGGPTLPDHAVFDLGHTKTPVSFDSLLAMADKLSKSLSGDGKGDGPIANLMDLGSAAVANNGRNMHAALDELAKALQLGGDDGAATRNAIVGVVDNLDELTSVAARNDQTLRQFGSGIRQLSDILADENLGSGDTGSKLNALITEVADLMQRNRGNIKNLVSNSQTMTKSLADYNDSVAEFLDDFPLITDNTYDAIDTKFGALRANVDAGKIVLDGQMLKEACNLLGLKQLGCATGTAKDMGPDLGISEMLAAMAGVSQK